ncbi:TVP38/TMEM64 family protein [Paenibacillus soyae]|uniref:TVP38/TMEM64 family membrane protein n=1 Tax=Paenibacillus soyae TaxID=2969249 RepID=A0A9X2SAS5_9BACL|nr:VTT domain-containing protein [Paenibacillus soyae]MCR2803977.1 VTT domain-containing protein [Paenibacillus soyae]
MKKRFVLMAYAAASAAILLNHERLLSWLDGGGIERVPLVIGGAVLLGLFPVVPFGVIAGLIGAQYGPFWGSVINVGSSTAAAALTFLAVRTIFQERGRRFIASHPKVDRLALRMERHAFMTIIWARVLPFVPAMAVNIIAAIMRMSFLSFAAATALGKIPVMIAFSVIGSHIFTSWKKAIGTLFIYCMFLAVVYAVDRLWNICFKGRSRDL